jgi:hypothetical protein
MRDLLEGEAERTVTDTTAGGPRKVNHDANSREDAAPRPRGGKRKAGSVGDEPGETANAREAAPPRSRDPKKKLSRKPERSREGSGKLRAGSAESPETELMRSNAMIS